MRRETGGREAGMEATAVVQMKAHTALRLTGFKEQVDTEVGKKMAEVKNTESSPLSDWASGAASAREENRENTGRVEGGKERLVGLYLRPNDVTQEGHSSRGVCSQVALLTQSGGEVEAEQR